MHISLAELVIQNNKNAQYNLQGMMMYEIKINVVP